MWIRPRTCTDFTANRTLYKSEFFRLEHQINMYTAMKRVYLVIIGSVLIVFFGYWGGLAVNKHSATFRVLSGTNFWQVLNVTEPSINNSVPLQSSTAQTKLDDNRNKTLYVKHYNLNDGHRLGNQMFRYASLLGIARAQGRQLIVSSGSDLENTFKLQRIKEIEASNDWPVIDEVNAYVFDKRLMNLSFTDMRIGGYLQSYKYFSNAADEVRQEFIFQDSIANEAATILHDLYMNYRGSMIVGVHVRRGDFTSERNKQLGYIIPEKPYFIKAFDLLKSKFPGRNITFLVVSDDLNWCKENLAGNSTIIAADASPAVHIALLSNCDHVIITSGSYSWWSGWLSGGYVIYFTGFMMKHTTFGDTFSSEDYYPRHWIGLGN